MNNQRILYAVGIIILIILAFWLWPKDEVAAPAIEDVSVETPVVAPSTNPLDAAPAINPLEKANPFKNEYTNPFE